MPPIYGIGLSRAAMQDIRAMQTDSQPGIRITAQQHALETSEAHEISLALAPRFPSWPRPVPMMAAGVAAGVLLGLMLVHLLHLTDSTLHCGDDVRTLANLPCFALVPELSRQELRTAPIEEFVVRRPLTSFSEQIRAVRAGLWLGVERASSLPQHPLPPLLEHGSAPPLFVLPAPCSPHSRTSAPSRPTAFVTPWSDTAPQTAF